MIAKCPNCSAHFNVNCAADERWHGLNIELRMELGRRDRELDRQRNNHTGQLNAYRGEVRRLQEAVNRLTQQLAEAYAREDECSRATDVTS